MRYTANQGGQREKVGCWHHVRLEDKCGYQPYQKVWKKGEEHLRHGECCPVRNPTYRDISYCSLVWIRSQQLQCQARWAYPPHFLDTYLRRLQNLGHMSTKRRSRPRWKAVVSRRTTRKRITTKSTKPRILDIRPGSNASRNCKRDNYTKAHKYNHRPRLSKTGHMERYEKSTTTST